MKYLGLILATLAVLMASQAFAFEMGDFKSGVVERGYNEKFRAFLENLRETLREGNETLCIPKLDPYYNESIAIEVNYSCIQGSGVLNNVGVVGLAGYNIDVAEIKLFSRQITVGLTWPHIFAEGSYNFNVKAFGAPVYGDGIFKVSANDLSVECVVKLSIVGGVKISKIDTKISLGALEFVVTGLFNDNDLSAMVSIAVSDLTPQLIIDYQEEITKYFNAYVTSFANEKLEGMSLSDLLGLIS